MTTMKAVRLHEFGGPEKLIYEDAPKPDPKDGEILIKIAGAGINPIDWKVESGAMQQMVPHTLPMILGWDVAGTVESVGSGVTTFAVGDAVYAMGDMRADGAYAEYVALPAAIVSPAPSSVNLTTAAAIPMAATTAWQALTEHAQLVSGQTILIHGGGGAVGACAVQFAKIKGATVIATASGDDLQYVRSIGADTVIDYQNETFEDIAKDVDAVLDTIGGDTQIRSWQTLREGGVLVSTVGITSDASAAEARGVQAKQFSAHPDAAGLTEVAGLVDSGRVKVRIDSVYPLAEASQAQEHAKSGHPRGKVVLAV